MAFLLAAAVLFIGSGVAFAEESGSIYGHISYLEGKPTVIRVDQTQEIGMVNLPLAPGDEIVTDADSKCEFQFDNGTVMRVGSDSHLKIKTVLAQSLTTRWKITTLELLKGKLYSINQSYNKERFQVITPNAAVNLKSNSKTTIELRDGETHLFVDKGKFDLMYGGNTENLKTERIKKLKAGYVVTKDHKLVQGSKRDIDFYGWNQKINKNFKELHFGISKVPKKIYKYPKMLVQWAERWSSLFGDWVYDDLLGYVWKPADEQFAYSARPFFHAKFVEMNGQMFLVPSQPWGWAPAHMGTWVWMDWGWTWVPGSSFSPGLMNVWQYNAEFSYPFFASSLYWWMRYTYGDMDLYYIYRDRGRDAWANSYRERFKKPISKPMLENVPKDVRKLISKLDKAPVATLKQRLGKYTPEMETPVLAKKTKFSKPVGQIKPVAKLERTMTSKSIKNTTPADRMKMAILRNNLQKKQEEKEKFTDTHRSGPRGGIKVKAVESNPGSSKVKLYRSFNPDTEWALRRGLTIVDSPRTNEVTCPELMLSSKTITPARRGLLRNTTGAGYRGGKGSVSSGGYSSGASSSSVSSSRATSTARSGSSGAGSAGKKKK